MLLLAYLSMLIDHIGIGFFPGMVIFRIIGRIAFPIFAIRLCEGYKHTKNFNYYLFRIIALAIISQPVYYLFFEAENIFSKLNICFILAFGLISIKILEKIREMKTHNLIFYITLTTLTLIAHFVPFSYGAYGLLMILIVYYFREDFHKFFISFSVVSFVLIPFTATWIQFIPLFIFPLLFYLDKNRFLNVNMKILGHKYIHYSFYPLHLLLLFILKILYV